LAWRYGKKIGFIGCGKIAQAIANGLTSTGILKGRSIFAYDPIKESSQTFQGLGSILCSNNKQVVESSDIVILSVKPKDVRFVLNEVRSCFNNEKLLVSIAMGINLSVLQSETSSNARIVRVMPNTPILIKKGANAFVRGINATNEDVKLIQTLFQSVGICHEVLEADMDTVTGLSGSGPAYIFVLIEALTDGAVRMGLSRHTAYRLAIQTVIGAGELALHNIGKKNCSHLRDDVTSPDGSTAWGLKCLEKNRFRYAVQEAVEAATLKSRSLSCKDIILSKSN